MSIALRLPGLFLVAVFFYMKKFSYIYKCGSYNNEPLYCKSSYYTQGEVPVVYSNATFIILI